MCSCPDGISRCKHVEALLFGLAFRLDERPELLFTLRGVQIEELVALVRPRRALRSVDAIPIADVGEIDRHNILRATFLAMHRAVGGLTPCPVLVLVDGNAAPPFPCPAETVVGGDGICISIAAASIVAKVTRDRIMTALAAEHAGYGWETNVGYGTREHCAALLRLGPTPHHRRSFAPVRNALNPNEIDAATRVTQDALPWGEAIP
ncbi:MAG: ribonuclease HII [Alphaproteobacteria bacterium]